jgi:type 1 fimbria pilin
LYADGEGWLNTVNKENAMGLLRKLKFHFLSKLLVIFVLGIAFSGSAHALTCKTTSGLPYAIPYASTLQVSSSLTAGAVIPGSVRPFTVTGSCTGTIDVGHPIVACVYNNATEIMPGVYTTGVTGVGMSILDSSGNPLKNALGIYCNDPVGAILSGDTFNFSGTFELVRTSGAIPPNSTFTPSAGQWDFGVYNTGVLLNSGNTMGSAIYPSGNVVINTLTCNVNNPATITLPTATLSSMSAVGSTTGTVPFNISLNCNNNAIVGITMDAGGGQGVQSASNGILNIQSGSGMASGVGIQILNANMSPMPLQTRVDEGSIAANITQNYAFYARYIRIASSTGAGSVLSTLVFTFDYE